MLKNITKRDIKFFVLGILFLFIAETISDWSHVKSEFMKGFHDGYHAADK